MCAGLQAISHLSKEKREKHQKTSCDENKEKKNVVLPFALILFDTHLGKPSLKWKTHPAAYLH